jgi:hypothetical protein
MPLALVAWYICWILQYLLGDHIKITFVASGTLYMHVSVVGGWTRGHKIHTREVESVSLDGVVTEQ